MGKRKAVVTSDPECPEIKRIKPSAELASPPGMASPSEQGVRRSGRKRTLKQFHDFEVELPKHEKDNELVEHEEIQTPGRRKYIKCENEREKSSSVLEDDTGVYSISKGILKQAYTTLGRKGDGLKEAAWTPSVKKSKRISLPTAKLKQQQKSNLIKQEFSNNLSVSLKQLSKTDRIHYICLTEGCSEFYYSLKKLDVHKKTKHNENVRHCCTACDKDFCTFFMLRSHMRMEHSDLQSLPYVIRNADIIIQDDHSLVGGKISVCTKCGYRYGQKEDPDHVCEPEELRYYCPCCDYESFDDVDMQDHLSVNHAGEFQEGKHIERYVELRSSAKEPGWSIGPNDRSCDVCKTQFDTNDMLKQHMNTKHANHPFACGLCKLCYGRKTALKKHMTSHRKTNLKCEFCKKEFYEKSRLAVHMLTHTGEKPHQCEICGNRYCDERAVRKHIQNKHTDPPQPKTMQQETKVTPQSQPETASICHLCGKSFNNGAALKKHLKIHNMSETLKCPHCELTFTEISTLKQHKLSHKTLDFSPSGIIKNISHRAMQEVFKEIKVYEENHPSGKPYKCRICDKRFDKQQFVHRHIRVIHMKEEDKSFVCNICKRGFTLSSALRTHMRLHSNVKPYKCRLCNKQFRQLGHVKDHLLHHGKAQLKCKICEMMFKSRGSLRRHVRIHCKINSFKCPVEDCMSAHQSLFPFIEHLSTCLENVGVATMFTCNFCREKFSKNDITSHYHIHENDAKFPCETCGVTFGTYHGLYFHKEKKGHFMESEYERPGNTNHVTRMSSPAIKQEFTNEELMSQYDYLEEEDNKGNTDNTLQQENNNDSSLYEEDGKIQGTVDDIDNDGDLILIAEQLTYMASGFPYTREVIVQTTENEGDGTITEITIEDMEDGQIIEQVTDGQSIEEVIIGEHGEQKNVQEVSDGHHLLPDHHTAQHFEKVKEEQTESIKEEEQSEGIEEEEQSEGIEEIKSADQDMVGQRNEQDGEGQSGEVVNKDQHVEQVSVVQKVEKVDVEVQDEQVAENGQYSEQVCDTQKTSQDGIGQNVENTKDLSQIQTAVEKVNADNINSSQPLNEAIAEIQSVDLKEAEINQDTAVTDRDQIDATNHKSDSSPIPIDLNKEKPEECQARDDVQIDTNDIVEPEHMDDTECSFPDDTALKEHNCVESAGSDIPSDTDSEVEIRKRSKRLRQKRRVTKRSRKSLMLDNFSLHLRELYRKRSVEYECTTCSKIFFNTSKLAHHKKLVHSENLKYICSECQKHFGTFFVYKSHIRMEHSDKPSVKFQVKNTNIVIKATKQKTVDREICVCTKCGYRHGGQEDSEHNCGPAELRYYCPCCIYTSHDLNQIGEHISAKHAEDVKKANPVDKFAHLRSTNREPGSLISVGATCCDTCDATFKTNDELKQHLNTKHAAHPFACGVCKMCYGRKSALQKHMLLHRALGYKCDVCNKEFSYKSRLDVHKLLHTGEKPYQCEVCGNRYCDEKTVRKHMMIKHVEEFRLNYPDRSVTTPATKKIKTQTPLICHCCGKSFPTNTQLKHHLKGHQKEGMFKCPHCELTFHDIVAFKKHKIDHQTVEISGAGNFKSMSTAEVHALFKEIKVYEENHPSGKPYKCRICDKRFDKQHFVHRHIRLIHMKEEDKSFVCNICKRGFTLNAALRTHMRLHSNVKPYKCRLCNKQFRQLGHVKDHLLHHGKAKLKCMVCYKMFKSKGNLKRHIRVHCKILPFKCPVNDCTAAFQSLYPFLTHCSGCLESTPSNTTLKCNFCSESFSTSEILKHYHSHENDVEFPCQTCGMSFGNYQSLYFHKEEKQHFVESEQETPRDQVERDIPIGDEEKDPYGCMEQLTDQYDYIMEEDCNIPKQIKTEMGYEYMDVGDEHEDVSAVMPTIVVEQQDIPADTNADTPVEHEVADIIANQLNQGEIVITAEQFAELTSSGAVYHEVIIQEDQSGELGQVAEIVSKDGEVDNNDAGMTQELINSGVAMTQELINSDGGTTQEIMNSDGTRAEVYAVDKPGAEEVTYYILTMDQTVT